jgi:hypothetical protein
MYPGAKVNPASPPINAPHMKNIHILTSDPFEKVVACGIARNSENSI